MSVDLMVVGRPQLAALSPVHAAKHVVEHRREKMIREIRLELVWEVPLT